MDMDYREPNENIHLRIMKLDNILFDLYNVKKSLLLAYSGTYPKFSETTNTDCSFYDLINSKLDKYQKIISDDI